MKKGGREEGRKSCPRQGGTVDFREFGEALDAVGYTGDVSIGFEYRDMIFEAIEREYRMGLERLAECGWVLPEAVREWPVSRPV